MDLGPIALVAGVVGAIAGILALFGVIILRRNVLGEAPTLGSAVAGNKEVLTGLMESHRELVQRVAQLAEQAVVHLDVEQYTIPGTTTPSALVCLRDGTGRNGVIIHAVGNPKERVVTLKDGELVGPSGFVMDKERKFAQRLLERIET